MMLMANMRVCVSFVKHRYRDAGASVSRGTSGGEQRRTLRGFSPPGNFNAENLGGETE